MIRINLLPVRAAKKKESARLQMTIAGLVTFFVVAASLLIFVAANNEAARIETEIKNSKAELKLLETKLGELYKIQEEKERVEEKLALIDSLEKARTGPVELFKKVSEAIPDNAWIVSINQMPGVITLNGFAASDNVVADFMRGLERQKGIGKVELVVAQRGGARGGRAAADKATAVELVSFTLKLNVGS